MHKIIRYVTIDAPKCIQVIYDDGTICKISKHNGIICTVKQYQNKKISGYMKCRIFKDGKSRYLFVHRIIAELFCENPNHYDYVDHINGNKLDNRAENLEWVTASENLKRAYESGLKKPTVHHMPRRKVRKSGRSWCEVTADERRMIENAYLQGQSINSIANHMRLNVSTVWKYLQKRGKA